ncbi:hypothetical protein [Ottowia sp.]|uniref:hypothetical protein n=1 Tax=Ottowia sp. TaxID=1898956 RepID=UPI0025E4C93D|nr:hypothetical protein [Ottowia sp.]MBK6616585.1 hypothetical protein [Ottowia sp.]
MKMITSKELAALLADTQGPLNVNEGVLWFETGKSVDLTTVVANARKASVVLSVELCLLDGITIIAPEGVEIVEADRRARQVAQELIESGNADNFDAALAAYEKAGFTMPMYATVSVPN